MDFFFKKTQILYGLKNWLIIKTLAIIKLQIVIYKVVLENILPLRTQSFCKERKSKTMVIYSLWSLLIS